MRTSLAASLAVLLGIATVSCVGSDETDSAPTTGSIETAVSAPAVETTVVSGASSVPASTGPSPTAPSPTAPSAPPSTASAAPDAEWVSTVVEVGSATGQLARLLVDGEGRVAVVYLREVARGEYDVVLDYCDDVSCLDMSGVTLASGRYWAPTGGATSDGPFVMGSVVDDEGRQSMVLWSCAGPACASTVETVVGDSPVAIHATPGEMPLIASANWFFRDGDDEWSPSGYDVFLGYCEDSACSSHVPVGVHQGEFGWNGPGSLQVLSNGSPILFFPGAENPDTIAWDVIVCDDADCSQAVVHHQDGTWPDAGTPAAAEIPSVIYAIGNQVRQLACTDDTCSGISDTLIHTIQDALYFQVASTYVGDTLVLLTQSVNEWPDEPEADDEDGMLPLSLELLACRTSGCVAAVQPPVAEANFSAIIATGDNSIAVVAQTGRAALCNPEGEQCVGQDQPLSQLTLYTTELDTG